MKLLIVTLIMTFTTFTYAEAKLADDVKSIEPAPQPIVDPDGLGTINIQVLETAHPAYSPFLLTVTATCADRRSHPDAMTPKVDMIIDGLSICQYRKATYKNGVLTLHYSTSPAVAGVAKCATRSQQDFDLREHCAQWQK
jgi:hypothetical protein